MVKFSSAADIPPDSMSARIILSTGLTARPDFVVFMIEVTGAEKLGVGIPDAAGTSDALVLGFWSTALANMTL